MSVMMMANDGSDGDDGDNGDNGDNDDNDDNGDNGDYGDNGDNDEQGEKLHIGMMPLTSISTGQKLNLSKFSFTLNIFKSHDQIKSPWPKIQAVLRQGQKNRIIAQRRSLVKLEETQKEERPQHDLFQPSTF